MKDWSRSDSKRILVTGRTGSGKSSFMIWWIDSFFELYFRVLIFDFEGEFFHRLSKTKVAHAIQKVESLGLMVENKNPIVCYEPGDTVSPTTSFDHFCWWAFELAKASPKPVLMVVDELQTYVNSYGAPESFMTCLLRGRKYGLDMMLASQQANIIHNTVRSSVSDVIAFGQGDEQAVKYVERLGIMGVQNLKQTEFYWRRIGSDQPEKHQLIFRDNEINLKKLL